MVNAIVRYLGQFQGFMQAPINIVYIDISGPCYIFSPHQLNPNRGVFLAVLNIGGGK